MVTSNFTNGFVDNSKQYNSGLKKVAKVACFKVNKQNKRISHKAVRRNLNEILKQDIEDIVE